MAWAIPTIPTTLESELKINPFLRFNKIELRESIQDKYPNISDASSEKVFEITLNKNYQWHLNKNSSEIITDLTQNISNVGPFIKSFLNILTQSSIAIFLLVGLFIVDEVFDIIFGLVIALSTFVGNSSITAKSS